MKRIKFLDTGRRAHPTDLKYPQLQHERGEVHDVPDAMAAEALAARNLAGEPRCELVEDLGPDGEEAPAPAPAPALLTTEAGKAKREDKRGRGAKALG